MSAAKKRLLFNAFATWMGTFAQMVAVFLVSPILVRGLGDRQYGVWALVESVLAYLTLFDLGIGAAVVRYVARFEGTSDLQSINRTFSVSVCLFSAAGLGVITVASLILGVFWPLLPFPADLANEAWWQLALLSFNLALGLPLGVFSSVLDGLQRYTSKTALRTVTLVIRSLAMVYVIRQGGGLFLIAVAVTTVGIIENIAIAVLAFWFLPGLRFSLRFVDRSMVRMIGGYSFDAFVAMIAGRISFQTDALVIAWFLPPAQITFFALAARVCDHAKNALRSSTYVLTPYVSRLEGLNQLDSIRNVYIAGTRWVLWLIVPVQLGICFLGKAFFRLWIGPDHAERCYPVLIILAIPLALALSQSIAGRILYGIGKVRVLSRIVIVEALANLGLSVALVGKLGIEGVALGTTIPNICMNLVLTMYVCKMMQLSWIQYMRRAFLLPCTLAVFPSAVWLLLQSHVPIDNWFQFVVVGAIGVLSYAVPAALVELSPRAILRSVRMLLAPWIKSPAL